MNRFAELQSQLNKLADPEIARAMARFFKTGKGQYAEHDKFIGIKIPTLRLLAKQYVDLSFADLKKLLKSPLHEYRSFAGIILVLKFRKADPDQKEMLYQFYLQNMKYFNNWDLVDLTAPIITGQYLLAQAKPMQVLKAWAADKNLWVRRIAIVSTWAFIRAGIYKPTLELSKLLLNDKQDLMHKACGWMLREVAKRDPNPVLEFIENHYAKMPRTMLRYAIERFPAAQRVKLMYPRRVD